MATTILTMAVRVRKPVHQRPQLGPHMAMRLPEFTSSPPKYIKRRDSHGIGNAYADSSTASGLGKHKMTLRLRIRGLTQGRENLSLQKYPYTPSGCPPSQRRQRKCAMPHQGATRLSWIRRLRPNSRRCFLLEHHLSTT
ncbi:uncharacterized protein N7483_002549 [Penicillium malachiteum]|uniref:uncharacterized protein n=1 Tax=Penicillium malachiteum TaxID=1324776 RepID=UPI0025475C9B|nr:uncharacterized protein N7483_002417 [Penicillium malachiteum]XP_056952135.1 uncharacterized protein N7483_002549 [Penicillium malachiteum]KAJ5737292.1 hypothetical protein N7483_002417 [Penicillium malachiteum]KAJ5737424.1 hypothetical protein N7483_002549 [Penicillium malachiteum]